MGVLEERAGGGIYLRGKSEGRRGGCEGREINYVTICDRA